MRLQIDTHTAEQLNTIRRTHTEITGGGYLPTIRWLLDYHRSAGELSDIRDAIDATLSDVQNQLPLWLSAAAQDTIHVLIQRAAGLIIGTYQPRPPIADVGGASMHEEGHKQYASKPGNCLARHAGSTRQRRTPRRK